MSKSLISVWHICLLLKLALYKCHIIIILLLFGFRLGNRFCTPVSEMTMSSILTNLGGPRSGTELGAGEKTLENWRFRALAF